MPTTCAFMQTVSDGQVNCVAQISCQSTTPVLTDVTNRIFQCYNTTNCSYFNESALDSVKVNFCTNEVSCSATAYFQQDSSSTY